MCVTHNPRSIIKTGAGLLLPQLFLDEYEQEQHSSLLNFGVKIMRESGYFHFQSTKPDAIGNNFYTATNASIREWNQSVFTQIISNLFLLSLLVRSCPSKFSQWICGLHAG